MPEGAPGHDDAAGDAATPEAAKPRSCEAARRETSRQLGFSPGGRIDREFAPRVTNLHGIVDGREFIARIRPEIERLHAIVSVTPVGRERAPARRTGTRDAGGGTGRGRRDGTQISFRGLS
jgi:hypothetical protein